MWILIVSGVISAVAAIHLWARRPQRAWRKLAWTPVTLLPVVGPLLYLALYEPLPPHEPANRPSGRNYLDGIP